MITCEKRCSLHRQPCQIEGMRRYFALFIMACGIYGGTFGLLETDTALGVEESPAGNHSGAPSYRLGAGDILKISVWKDESLMDEVTVLADGFISFPLVGPLLAEGKTLDQFTDDLKKRLEHYIPKPSVSVIVKESRSLKIYVIGKVNRPGEFLVAHPINVMQALSLAGGITPYASQSGIKILRRLGEKQVAFSFDYGDVLQGDSLEQNITLERWDVVMVP